jgi:tetratricopeptide (TPR) repeat protein
MTVRSITKHALGVCLFSALTFSAVPLSAMTLQNPPASDQPKISDNERKAIDKINTAPDLNAKMAAAGEFLKKFDKSPMRTRVASYLAGEIMKAPDNQQRLQAAQTFTTTFNKPEETDLIKPTVIDTYVKLNKYDEAYQEAAKYLPGHPDDVTLQTQLAIIGADLAQRQSNPKFVQVSQEYGKKAIELMEADKRPATLDAAAWTEYRTQWLPRLYQSQGVLSYMTNNKAAAKENFEKSVGLNDRDPVTLMMVGTIVDDEYQELAKRYNAEKAGPGKDAILKQAFGKMDEVIDWFARAVAAAEGKPEYAPLQKQLMDNLDAYYKSRNNGSTQGLKELIEKYKKK